jgi:phosphate transport system substrate-binding protein
MRKRLLYCVLSSLIIAAPAIATADHQIKVVGSSTVFPFAQKVAEQFSRMTGHEVPLEESTGTGEGFRRFCAGSGDEHPDAANASRRIKRAEMESCAANGVGELVEIKIGYDGITLANAKKAPFFSLNHRHLFLALAATVPFNGELVPNPYKKWMEISLTLPSFDIRVFGPPPTSGTRDSFIRLVLERGCRSFPEIQALEAQSPERFREICRTLRTDEAYIDFGENDELIVEKLASDPSALGIFGYSFLSRHRDLIKGSSIGGIRPDFENISSGRYSLVRPLYIYVKRDRTVDNPALRDYVEEFTNEWTLGPDGYLVEEGLIPLPKEDRKRNYYIARELTPLSIDGL